MADWDVMNEAPHSAASPSPGEWDVANEAPHEAAATAPAQPSIIDRLQTNPVIGAPLQTVMRAGQGTEQLLAHSAADLADLGGHAPNSFADTLRAIANHIDTTNAGQNQRYEGAKSRVIAASPNPRFENAAINTGETMGNMLNPAGLTGNMVEAAPGMVNAATRGVVSGAAYGATQPVEGDDYWTQKAKQVGIGGLTGAVTAAATEKLGGVKPTTPKAQTFKDLATDSYDAAKSTGATVPKTDFQNAIDNAEAKARENVTYRPTLQPKAATAIEQIKSDLKDAGDNVTFADMDVARRIARTVLSSPDKNERAVAHTIIDGIDDYVKSLPGPEGSDIATARNLFARGAKLDNIERVLTKAQDQIGANQTRTRLDNAIRQQFKSLKNNQAAFRQFSPDEQAAITQIIRGSTVQNAARWAGKLSPTTQIPIVGELSVLGNAIASGNDKEAAAAVGAMGVGLAGQHIANRMGENNVNQLSRLVAGQGASTLPRPTPDALVWNPLPGLAVQAFGKPGGQ